MTLGRHILPDDDNKTMTTVTMRRNISYDCSLTKLLLVVRWTLGSRERTQACRRCTFDFFNAYFSVLKIAYFPLSSIAYFSVSKTFMCSTIAALIRIYMVNVGGSDWKSYHRHHHHQLQQSHHHRHRPHLLHQHHCLKISRCWFLAPRIKTLWRPPTPPKGHCLKTSQRPWNLQ